MRLPSVYKGWIRAYIAFTAGLKDCFEIIHFSCIRRLTEQGPIAARTLMLVFMDKLHIIEDHSASYLFMQIRVTLINRHLAFL